MKPKLLLYIAAGLLIFHVAGHTVGHSGWKMAEEPVKQEVIRQMTSYDFPFMGAMRSMGDYFEGYGWLCSIALIFFALVQILCAREESTSALSHKILIVLAVSLLAWASLEFVYFFAFAGSITLLSAVATGFAWWRLR